MTVIKKLLKPSFGNSLLVALVILSMVLLITVGIILISGYNPVAAFKGLWEFSLGDMASFSNVLNRAMALIMAGLAVAVAFQSGFYNIGVEGQIFLGALASAVIGYKITGLPMVVHIPLVFAVGILMGMLGAFIPAILKTKLKVDEVITCIMLNSVYVLFTGYLATYPFRDPDRWSGTTPPVVGTAELPYLIERFSLSSGILISLCVAFILYIVMRYTNTGYKWKMTGLNPSFARYGGLNVPKVQLNAALVSGALAGITGSLLVCGTQHRFWMQIGKNIGWDGVLIGMLAMNNPLGVIVGGFTFAFLKTGSLGMEIASNVPAELISVALAFLILIVTGRSFIVKWTGRFIKRS
jgi:general nucleoside transport system permease protein